MKKSLMVLGVLVLACGFAAAGNWTFGFNSVYGGEYCNYEVIDNNNIYGVAGIPAGGPVYEGIDNLVSACGLPYNGTIGGFGPYTLPKGVTFLGYKVAVSKGVVYGDSAYDAEFGYYSGYQWTVATSLACSTKATKKNKDFWIGLGSFSNFVFADNAGPTGCTIPAAGKHNGLTTTGHAAK